MECFSEHAIGHKDADVREGVKELALQASKIIGVRIERYLDAMSERHRRAVISAATAAEEAMAGNTSTGLAERGKSVGPQFRDNVHYSEHLLRQGRGRGRGRNRTERDNCL